LSHLNLNLTRQAWRQFRRNWRIPASPSLLWQTYVPGSLFSTLTGLQSTMTAQQLATANTNNTVVILGYWRSGTTLLHELLCLDQRYSYPTTHACMNPHHFLLTEETALAKSDQAVQRPMDEMEVRPSSPQEDEFALLSLGAHSPYEALLMPSVLREALKLSDPADLPEPDRNRWDSAFMSFLKGVAVRGAGRPVVLKSPTHGFRVGTLRRLLPDARFILIVRNPMSNFESVVRMWKRMFEIYCAIGAIPSDDEIREAVLEDRPRFEQKLESGSAGLPGDRFTTLTYEALAADPYGEVARLYERMNLGDFDAVSARLKEETEKRKDYRALGKLPSPEWRDRIRSASLGVFQRYGYSLNS